ncbi:unnamed protein product [Paramecium pentaurelia]|uniref:Response regulatory domain-containing protein n=1 Tax=Paramecium pentaurelia TaxID=43138 RepID=A0A8S1WB44_9CILI|nr:unnamed protein product [Paramecium pentaurelia]
MEGKKVLVVDDEPFAQNLLKMLYGVLKVECIVVANGKEALEEYQKSANFVHILMDIHMPIMDGYDSTKQIRLHEKAKGLPRCKILGLSGDGDPKTKAACISAGMDDLLVKPLKKEQLQQFL